MPDAPDGSDERGNDGASSIERPAPASRGVRVSGGLEALASIQRQVATIDFSAIRAVQRAIAESPAVQAAEVLAAQDRIAKNFAKSVDFSDQRVV